MEFDITQLDKKILVQALFAHSAPLNLGQAEYDYKKKLGDNVDGLSDEECEMILYEFKHFNTGGLRILDYHKGKPIKLVFYKNRNGRVLVDTGSYDARNGKYRFFEALLNIFSIDEILITKKGYKHYEMTDLPEHLVRPKEQEEMFKNILKNTIERENEYGKYWSIDENKVSYTLPFMRL
ncbi:MAG: hypothetical protein LBM67_05610 [Lentimicrobiaceae bacterium]|nr:hypothetical protein [Lentimicrobiaceae bacterium]